MKEIYDVIIVGAGMAGMSTAYNLIGKAQRVLVCEQKTPAHIGSSSYGDTRMYREMYSDPWLCQVAKKTSKLWESLEQDSGMQLRSSHGLLFYGEDWGEETIEGSIQGAKQVMTDQKIAFEEYDATRIEKDFPLRSKPEWIGLFEPNAGAVLVEEVFGAWQKMINSAGFEIRNHTKVIDFDDQGNQVVLTLENGDKLYTKKLVLTAGPWTKHFLQDRTPNLDYSVWMMLWGYYTIEESYRDQFPQWFNFQHRPPEDPNQGLFYGFPSVAETESGEPFIKVGIDWALPELKLNQIKAEVDLSPPKQLVQILEDFIHNYMYGVKDRLHVQLSPYTMSSDVQFCLDKLSSNVAMFSHGSGQSFKFAPMIGKCLAALTLEETSPINLEPWRLERLVA